MPNRYDILKKKIDKLRTRQAVLKSKVDETKADLKSRHKVTTIKGAKALKKKLEKEANEIERQAEEIIDEIEEALEDFDDDE